MKGAYTNFSDNLSELQIDFNVSALRREETNPNSKWTTRQFAIAASFVSFGMNGTYEYWTPRYEHHIGEYIRVPLTLTAMYYDPRIKHGMTKEEAMPIAREIAQEIVNADSFEDWLTESRAR